MCALTNGEEGPWSRAGWLPRLPAGGVSLCVPGLGHATRPCSQPPAWNGKSVASVAHASKEGRPCSSGCGHILAGGRQARSDEQQSSQAELAEPDQSQNQDPLRPPGRPSRLLHPSTAHTSGRNLCHSPCLLGPAGPHIPRRDAAEVAWRSWEDTGKAQDEIPERGAGDVGWQQAS